MLNEFLTHINEKSLFKTTDKILLAVSGGKDSVVLFDLFLKAKLGFSVAHCNFQLRGEESDLDEEFVSQLAHNQQVTFHSIKFKTKNFAKENHLSTQLAARKLRYDWFEEIRQKFDYDFVATAHHFNDVIETVLLNITKGTGMAGLHGIPERNGFVIRPMLFATREQIDNYISENKLTWREDSSNQSNDYQRNLLRNEVIPLLKKINPNLEETFRRNVDRFTEIEKIVQFEVQKLSPEISENGSISLKINNIKSSLSGSYVLEEFLKKYNFNTFQAQNIYKSLDGQSGKIFHSPTHTLVKNREELLILEVSECKVQSLECRVGSLSEIEGKAANFEFNGQNYALKIIENSLFFQSQIPNLKSQISIDFDKISFPLTLRNWKKGDWFVPLGMKGKKKISDFLIDKKISVHLKKMIFLLTSNEQVVWVVGHQLDDRFKVSETTKRVLQITIF